MDLDKGFIIYQKNVLGLYKNLKNK